MKVIVVGGGVAGITAAFAIHNRLGWEVVIYEGLNSENFEEREGVGFVITPAGIDVLRAIGIHSELPSERMHSINVMDPNEQPVFTKQFGEEDTHLVVLRKNFRKTLTEHLPPNMLHKGCNVVSVTYNHHPSARAVVSLANGTKDEADIVIVADGRYSTLRTQMFPQLVAAPKTGIHEICGFMFEQSVFDAEKLRGKVNKIQMPGVAFGYIVYDTFMVWWQQFNVNEYPLPQQFAASNDVRQAHLAHVLQAAHFPELCIRILEHSQSIPMAYSCDNLFLMPLPSYHTHRAVLVGDAAHPLSIFTSQGVNSALNDVLALVNALEKHATTTTATTNMTEQQQQEQQLQQIQAAFAAYERERMPINSEYLKAGIELVNNFMDKTIFAFIDDKHNNDNTCSSDSKQ